MKMNRPVSGAPLVVASFLVAAAGCGNPKAASDSDQPGDGTEVKLCDNHTTTTVPAGQAVTAENGQKIADSLMAQWRAKNPDREWVEKTQRSWTVAEPFDNSYLVATDDHQDQAYGRYTALEVATWAREAELAATEGARVFHNGDTLGSTIAVSCDMCHPDGANTHPETYPKYQVQLGRVVLLRDMINWCLEHPVRAPPMAADDPRMRALESYIYAQRKGEALSYGKH
ncbi:c-type cytochrome [Haliangium sp.]|uniref:c-type cytochrome n=1 Tax=Haliangium sp. TaxID=2663208 RepID=UPI003D0AB2C2